MIIKSLQFKYMSKLSVRPDESKAPPLKPTQFPFPNLSNFKISSASSQNNSRTRLPQESENMKFVTTPQTLPNLFQYNDRSKLILSSDSEEDYPEPKEQKSKIDKKKEIESLNIDHYKENPKKTPIMIQEQEVLSPKFNIATEKKTFPAMEETQQKTNEKRSKEIIKQIQMYEQESLHQFSAEENSKNIEKLNQSEKKMEEKNEDSRFAIQSEQDISKTDVILEKIQAEQKTLILPTQSYESMNESKTTPITPSRRRRNKIFDHSAKRDLSYLGTSRKNQTPNKEVQTQSRYVMKQNVESSRSRVERTPQVKALGILDKLVDQIGTDQYSCRSKHYCQEESGARASQIFFSLSQFNKMSLQQILKIQNINDISMISEPSLFSRIESTHEKASMWKERVSKLVLDIPFSNSVQYEIVKRFEKICQKIETAYNITRGYRDTSERLTILQGKLEQYVNIIQNQDSKRLYSLIKDVNCQIDRMKQIKAKCGSQRLENMFSEYLNKQISLLAEIKGDIQNNFMHDYPMLTF